MRYSIFYFVSLQKINVHKSGFVNIIGSPNVGKSTLMNRLVGEKVSIITSKAQTTRHRIMGIVSGEDFQIVYSDTPGVVNPAYKLHESMLGFVQTALKDADIILFITDIFEKETNNKSILEKLKKTDIPILTLVNKIDLGDNEKVAACLDYWKTQLPKSMVIGVSALHNYNIEPVLEKVLEMLPEGEAFFPKDELSDKPMRFFVSEIIREKILLRYKKEIPYSCEVEVEEFKDEKKIVKIRAVIYVIRDTQKGIIIGHQGSMIKHLGIDSRKDIEEMLGKQVHLELFVKVRKDWRDNPGDLQKFGYQ